MALCTEAQLRSGCTNESRSAAADLPPGKDAGATYMMPPSCYCDPAKQTLRGQQERLRQLEQIDRERQIERDLGEAFEPVAKEIGRAALPYVLLGYTLLGLAAYGIYRMVRK